MARHVVDHSWQQTDKLPQREVRHDTDGIGAGVIQKAVVGWWWRAVDVVFHLGNRRKLTQIFVAIGCMMFDRLEISKNLLSSALEVYGRDMTEVNWIRWETSDKMLDWQRILLSQLQVWYLLSNCIKIEQCEDDKDGWLKSTNEADICQLPFTKSISVPHVWFGWTQINSCGGHFLVKRSTESLTDSCLYHKSEMERQLY